MLTLIRNASVPGPDDGSRRDILIAGEHIEAVAEPGSVSISGLEVDDSQPGMS